EYVISDALARQDSIGRLGHRLCLGTARFSQKPRPLALCTDLATTSDQSASPDHEFTPIGSSSRQTRDCTGSMKIALQEKVALAGRRGPPGFSRAGTTSRLRISSVCIARCKLGLCRPFSLGLRSMLPHGTGGNSHSFAAPALIHLILQSNMGYPRASA